MTCSTGEGQLTILPRALHQSAIDWLSVCDY
jgi:hypothetical protein